MREAIVYYFAILANAGMIVFALSLIFTAYGDDRVWGVMILVPPLLSLLALSCQGDLEERRLKKRLRKAQLKKQLDDLKGYTD